MGNKSPKSPARLPEKLREIRLRLGLSQNQMAQRVVFENSITQSQISAFERGTRTPSILTLLRYARSTGINLEAIVDDEIELPKDFPRIK